MTDLLGLLALMAAVGAAAFYAGWRSAAAYLPAARAVSDVANAAVAQSNSYASTLDGVRAEMVALVRATETATKASAAHDQAVEETLQQLFQGLERAGLARSPRAVPRQHGETADG